MELDLKKLLVIEVIASSARYPSLVIELFGGTPIYSLLVNRCQVQKLTGRAVLRILGAKANLRFGAPKLIQPSILYFILEHYLKSQY